MKNFTYLLLAGLFSFILLDSNAQTLRFLDPNSPKPARGIQTARQTPPRCQTMEELERYFQNNPEARAMAERNKNLFAPETAQGQNQRVQAIVTIPVVFHIVGNATRQAQVTDADVIWQLNKMNEDFGGSNADSTNGVGFYPVRAFNGYCQIRFCMAQRNGIDLPANGIDRVVSTLTTTQNCGNTNLIKHTSSGGADAWDPSRFFNIWVGEFGSCLLGIATFPGTGNANEQGIDISYEGFSNNPAYADPAFDLGRTVIHEAGHYFGLYHIWGDESGCTGSDFRQLPGTCVLPASVSNSVDVNFGDTPNQAGATTNCPSGVATDACATTAPGKQYQNYMDYTEDACYSMFTKMQVDRMQWVLDNCRASLKTSNGCTPPPAAGGDDGRISAIINPVNGSTLGCSGVTPFVTIQNLGSNVLTSAKINLIVNGTAVLAGGYPFSWSGSLAQGGSANVTLPTYTIPGNGTYVFKIHTTLPNGLTDANTANDTATSSITKIAPSNLPVVNGFETAFLPAGWSNLNPNGDALTWFRFNPTGGAAGGSVWAAVIDNYNYDVGGTYDDIVTPVINTTTLLANDSLLISFDLAHKNYPDPGFEDSLKVVVTTNCGATWTTVWQRGDPQLATAGSSTGLYNPPAQGDWRNQKVSIGNNLFGGGQVQVAIRNVNGFGNTTFIDNINIDIKPRKDMQTTAILRPNATECAPPFVPSITVRNAGGETVTAFKTGYILNGGTPVIQVHNITLAIGESATVTFPSINPPAGINTIKMFVADPITPSVGPDGTPANDTITRTFSVPPTVTNIIQGFEGTTFIPANWSLINANGNVTWIRKTPGKASDYSAFIDNYNNNTINQLDIMQSPPVNTVGADGVTITFDLAHKDYPGSFDRLRVLVSTNCGTSYTSVYSKAGGGTGPTALATAGSSDEDFTDPLQNEWRTETITLNNTFTGGNLIVQFENRNDFGNNVFIDNINIVPVFKRDIEVLSLSPQVQCVAAFTPVATIRNRGTEAITGYTIAYTIGTGTPVTTVVTGANIAPGATVNVTLTGGTLVAGANSIKVYSFAPVTASGTGDQYLLNDTITRTVSVAGSVTAPTNIVETFEGTIFAPTGWVISNPDNGLTWQKAGTGKSSLSSAFIRNFIYFANGQRDALYTPALNYTAVDSVMLSFDLSATTKDLPADAPLGLDTLEVLVTKDCGNTFTSVYKKWGDQLQTIGNSSFPQSTEFSPGTHPFLWRTETINLSSYASGGPLQVVFRNSTNNQNNVYIDNVNFRTVLLPPRLKSDGVIVTPNPSTGQFNLWFLQAPTDLSYVTVLTSAGQLVWNKVYNGTASNIVPINLGNVAAGIYLVNLGYTDKSKDKQIKIIVSR